MKTGSKQHPGIRFFLETTFDHDRLFKDRGGWPWSVIPSRGWLFTGPGWAGLSATVLDGLPVCCCCSASFLVGRLKAGSDNEFCSPKDLILFSTPLLSWLDESSALSGISKVASGSAVNDSVWRLYGV